jgi:hypothetical protein
LTHQFAPPWFRSAIRIPAMAFTNRSNVMNEYQEELVDLGDAKEETKKPLGELEFDDFPETFDP